MRTFVLNKLVRDGILPDMEAKGQKVLYRTLNDETYLKELARKLVEEAKEFKLESNQEALKELADLLEVIEALAPQLGSDFESLRALQAERRKQRGGFKDRIYVEKIMLQDADKWVDYYAANPIKFPEIKE